MKDLRSFRLSHMQEKTCSFAGRGPPSPQFYRLPGFVTALPTYAVTGIYELFTASYQPAYSSETRPTPIQSGAAEPNTTNAKTHTHSSTNANSWAHFKPEDVQFDFNVNPEAAATFRKPIWQQWPFTAPGDKQSKQRKSCQFRSPYHFPTVEAIRASQTDNWARCVSLL